MLVRPDLTELERAVTEPLCDPTFRERLLRQGLSSDEMAQFVDLVENERGVVAAALPFLLAEARKVETLTKERDSDLAEIERQQGLWTEQSRMISDLAKDRDALAARVETLREATATLRSRASIEPLGVDISDYGDEWVLGFLAGQVNALDEFARAALEEASDD